MQNHSEFDLRALLACDTVPGPPDTLVDRTLKRLYVEQEVLAAAPALRGQWVLLLAGLAVMMTLCLFYMLTVGTILTILVPAGMSFYFEKSLIVFTVVGVAVLAGLIVTMAINYILGQRSGDPARAYVRVEA